MENINSRKKNDQPKSGECYDCGKQSTTVCLRCGTFYCSKACQKNDWITHRYICGRRSRLPNFNSDPMKPVKSTPPQVVPSPKNIPKTITDSKVPTSGSNVSITAVIKSNFVYIRSLRHDDNICYCKTMNVIKNEGRKAKNLDKMPKIGDLVIANFQNERHCRALVLKPKSVDNIQVNFIDYGHIEEKKLSDLFEASNKCFEFPKQAIPLILRNVPDIPLQGRIKHYLHSYIESTHLKLVHDENFSENIMEGEIYDLDAQESLNDVISFLNRKQNEPLQEPLPVVDQGPVFYANQLETVLIPEGENVTLYIYDISIVEETFYISCVPENEVLGLGKFINKIQKLARENFKIYMPVKDEICIAFNQSKNEWGRGKCLEVFNDGESASIQFIDYGNVEQIHKNKIQKYPAHDLKYPVVTCDCEIDGLPEDDDVRIGRRLKELLQGRSKLIARKVEQQKEFNYNVIYVESILHLLRQDGLV